MKRNEGFTLVEMLVALVLGALLMAFVSWSVAGLARQLRRPPPADATVAVEAGERLQAMIAGMKLPSGDESFDGTARGFSAVVSVPSAVGAPGLVRMTLETRGTASDLALIARFAPLNGDATWPAVARETVLVDRLRRVEFDYNWRTVTYGPSDRLPQSIKVTLVPASGHKRRLVLQPRITTDGSCRFDPISQTCRP